MSPLILYHNAMSTCAQKVRFVLAEKDLDFESRAMDLRAGEQHQPDYLKLNPKGVVPTLIAKGAPIIESTVICEYLEDLAPEFSMRPKLPEDIAKMRLWMKRLDDGLHAETGVMSNAIAFRYQKLAKGEAFARKLVEGIPDPAKKERMRSIVFDGVDSPLFLQAMSKFDALLEDMDTILRRQDWLVGADLSLADAAYAPYITRLDQLQLHGLWADRPAIANWYERLKLRKGYQEGLTKWFDDQYLSLMKEKGEMNWPQVKAYLQAS
jgi:glutathione S-transferase